MFPFSFSSFLACCLASSPMTFTEAAQLVVLTSCDSEYLLLHYFEG